MKLATAPVNWNSPDVPTTIATINRLYLEALLKAETQSGKERLNNHERTK
jgi:hypothetical protein